MGSSWPSAEKVRQHSCISTSSMLVCLCLPCISSPVTTQIHHKVTAWSTMCVCVCVLHPVTTQKYNAWQEVLWPALIQCDTNATRRADSIPLRVSVGSSQHKSVFTIRLLQGVHIKSLQQKIMHILSATCKLHPRNYSRSVVQATHMWLHSSDTSHVKSHFKMRVSSWALRQVWLIPLQLSN